MEQQFLKLLLQAHSVQAQVSSNGSNSNSQNIYEDQLQQLEIEKTEELLQNVFTLLFKIKDFELSVQKVILVYVKNFIGKFSHKEALFFKENSNYLKSFIFYIGSACDINESYYSSKNKIDLINVTKSSVDPIVDALLSHIFLFICNYCSKELKSTFVCSIKDFILSRISGEQNSLVDLKHLILNSYDFGNASNNEKCINYMNNNDINNARGSVFTFGSNNSGDNLIKQGENSNNNNNSNNINNYNLKTNLSMYEKEIFIASSTSPLSFNGERTKNNLNSGFFNNSNNMNNIINNSNNNNNNNNNGNNRIESYYIKTNYKMLFVVINLVLFFEDDISCDKSITETHLEIINDSLNVLSLLREINILINLAQDNQIIQNLILKGFNSSIISVVYLTLVNSFYNFTVNSISNIQKNITLKVISLDIIYESSLLFTSEYIRVLFNLLFFDSLPLSNNNDINANNNNSNINSNCNDNNKLLLLKSLNFNIINNNLSISDILEIFKSVKILDIGDLINDSGTITNEGRNLINIKGMLVDVIFTLSENCINDANYHLIKSSNNILGSSKEQEIKSILICYNSIFSNITNNYLRLLFDFINIQSLSNNGNLVRNITIKESSSNSPEEIALLNLVCKVLNYISSMNSIELIIKNQSFNE